jgi:alkaline phosphatase D
LRYVVGVLTRRGFVIGTLSTGALACGGAPRVRSTQPRITHGVQSGDVRSGRALIWARVDEPARMVVEWDTSDRFSQPRRVAGPVVGSATDHAATVAIDGLPDGQTVWYRVRFEREAARGASPWATGRFATPRGDRFRFAWTGDTCGQGFGRNPAWGGLRGYEAIRRARPAFLLHSGDMIYADH